MGVRILVPRPRRKLSFRAGKLVWLAIGVAIWGIAYTFFGASGMVGVMRARADVEELERRVAEAERTNRELYEEIRALRDDPQTIEHLGREQLFLARPGDKVYLLPRAEADAAKPASDPDESSPTPVPFER